MGGENETYVAKKDKNKDSATLTNFRIHDSNGEIHFHDDKSKLKCAVPVAVWWKGWDKIRSNRETFKHDDTTNNTSLSVSTFVENGILDVSISVEKITISPDYKKLETFSKRK